MSVVTKSDEMVQLLTRAGLTGNQAVVYFALNRIGEAATASSISKVSHVSREKVYCVLPELQEKGFVERILTAPVRFNAISLKEALSKLIEKKVYETNDLKQKAKELIREAAISKLKQNTDEDTIVVCKHEIGFKRRMKTLESARESIDVINPSFNDEESWKKNQLKLRKILKGPAKIRFVVQKPIESKKILENIEKLSKNPNFELRYAQSQAPLMSIYVIDRRMASIAISAEKYPEDYSVLSARTPVLISLTSGYFEMVWNNSKPFNYSSKT